MRLSDILKNTGVTPKPPATQAAPLPVTPAAHPPPSSDFRQVLPVSPKPADPQTTAAPDNANAASSVYTRAITESKTLINSISADTTPAEPITCPGQIVNLIENSNDDLVMLADRATPDVYLYGHSVNVCIYSTMMGKGLGMAHDKLVRLANAAFFHDMCLSKHLLLIMKNAKLAQEEVNSVHDISSQCTQLIDKCISNFDLPVKKSIMDVMFAMNERKYGSKEQPAELSEENSEFVKLITITDIYEALTHPRPYRDRFLPHDAIKTMISTAENNFDPALLKAFIEIISLYPLGSYVRLNTDEIARVTGVNRGLPTRPRILILTDPSGVRHPQAKYADLSASPMLFVKEALDETKLKLTDKKLMLELKAIRWWVKSL
jgi:hypothetical protein